MAQFVIGPLPAMVFFVHGVKTHRGSVRPRQVRRIARWWLVAVVISTWLSISARAQGPAGGTPSSDPYTTASSQSGSLTPVSNWPRTASMPNATAAAVTASSIPPAPDGPDRIRASQLFQPAETIARVGEECIFRGDLEADAEVIMATALQKMSAEERQKNRSQLNEQRDKLVDQLLKQAVDRKLMYLEFMRNQPTDRLKEVKAGIEKKIGGAFEEDLLHMLDKLNKTKEEEYGELIRQDAQLFRLSLLMSQNGISSASELDRLLRGMGTSLHYQQQVYGERKLGQQQLFKAIEYEPEIMPDEMLKYYREHENDFTVPLRAKWERLTARFDRFSDKSACGEAIAAMGNEVYQGGAPFWAVAKRSSQGTDANKGGLHDWMNWGDLSVSRPIHEAIFSLPLNQMSPIIEDAEGLHIIRVLQRDEAHVVPFTEAQVEIKKILQSQKRSAEIVRYIEKLHERTPVWTVNDSPAYTTTGS